MPQHRSIRAVSLDAGNTLLSSHPAVAERYSAAAGRYGAAAPPAEVEQRFKVLWRTFEQSRQTNLSHADREGTKRFWRLFVAAVFEPWMADFSDFDAFFEYLYDDFARPETWRLYDDALPTLHALADRGVALALISNWDWRLHGILKGCRIDSFFAVTLISAEEGTEKPASELFLRACSRLGVSPGEMLHVGDSLTDDVRGALDAGAQAAWIDRHNNDGGEADAPPLRRELAPGRSFWVLHSLRHLPALV